MTAPEQTAAPRITWSERGASRDALWRSEAELPPPSRVVVADDRIKADKAFHLAAEGTAMLWRGDFQNARQLLNAMARRIDARRKNFADLPFPERFHLYRQAQAQRARTLGLLLIPFESDHTIPLRRAPDVREACFEVYGASEERYVASLRELLGIIGAHEWRRRGMEALRLRGGAMLGADGNESPVDRIHPHYGIFAPARNEYVSLVAQAPLPSTELAFDIGTGTGVLAAVLARRGVQRVVATDNDPRAIECARENIERLGLGSRIELAEADLFPPGRAPLIVCNPPWLPGRAVSRLERSVYDPESRMLRAFLDGLRDHLSEGGEGWLILSDLAEHLSLRKRETLLSWFETAGLAVVERHETQAVHPKSTDRDNALYAARAAERTSLWRLRTI